MNAWCVYCHKQISDTATKCAHCGKPLTDKAIVIKCASCGKMVIKGAGNCKYCGEDPTEEYEDFDDDDFDQKAGLGIAALVLSIVGFLTGFIGIGIIFDIIAVVLGLIAIISKKQKSGLGVAGLVLGTVAIILNVFVFNAVDSVLGTSNKSETITNVTETAESSNLTSTDLAQYISTSEYAIESLLRNTYYILVVTNNSSETVQVDVNAVAKDSSSTAVGASNSSERAIASGESVCLTHYFDGSGDDWKFEYTMSVQKEDFYKPVFNDIDITKSILDDKIVLTLTNNGEDPADFVEATAIFFKGGEPVYYGSTYITDADSQLKPNATLSGEIDCYESFDDVQVFVHGRR